MKISASRPELNTINQSLNLITISSLIGIVCFSWLLQAQAYLPTSLGDQRTLIASLLLVACFLESTNSFLWDIFLAKAWTKKYLVRTGLVAPSKLFFLQLDFLLAD